MHLGGHGKKGVGLLACRGRMFAHESLISHLLEVVSLPQRVAAVHIVRERGRRGGGGAPGRLLGGGNGRPTG